MEQKYIYSFSQIEDKVKALHETNTEAAAAVALSWLGLSRDELKTLRVSDYNSTMRMLHSAGRVVYVREDLIADMLKAICEEAPEYSMGFFITDSLRSLRTLSQTLAQVLTHVSLHRKKWKSSSSAATTIQKLISNSPDYRTESVPNLFRGVFCFFVYFA